MTKKTKPTIELRPCVQTLVRLSTESRDALAVTADLRGVSNSTYIEWLIWNDKFGEHKANELVALRRDQGRPRKENV